MAGVADAEATIRLALPGERLDLEELQRRASLVSATYRAVLIANPDAIELPADQIAAGAVWVAELHGKIAGFVVVLSDSDREPELDGLFVEPALWRRGLGATLTEHAARVARARGAAALTVVANPEARAFYEAQGFSVTGEVPTRFDIALAMRRSLA